MIKRISETAPASERRRIYEGVKGHKWKGNCIEGWWVDDDNLWNTIDDDNRLAKT